MSPEGFLLRSDSANLLLLASHPDGVPHAVMTFLDSLGAEEKKFLGL